MTAARVFGLTGVLALLVAPWQAIPPAGSLALDGLVLIFAAGWEYIQ